MRSRETNLAAIAVVARGLDELLDRVAFVGGAVVALYIDDTGAGDVRPTEDIDCVIELAGLGEYAQLENRLRKLGFSNATEPGAPICRWRFQGLTVDVMPTSGAILGFSNRWYPQAMKELRRVAAPGVEVCIFSLPYFVASKFEAFKTRGQMDWRASPDLEDIVAVLDGATDAARELSDAQGDLGEYLKEELGRLLHHADVDEILAGHLEPSDLSTSRAARIKGVLRRVVEG